MTLKPTGHVFVKVSVPKDLKEEFSRVCDFYEMTESATIRLIMSEWCQEFDTRHGKKNAEATWQAP